MSEVQSATMNESSPILLKALAPRLVLMGLQVLLVAGCSAPVPARDSQPEDSAPASDAHGVAPDGLRVLGVVRWETGGPLAQAQIQLGDRGHSRETTADDKGRFEFAGLSPGDYPIRAGSSRGTAFVETRLQLREGDNEVVLVVPDPATLELVVTDEAAAPLRARVLLWALDFPWSPKGARAVRYADTEGRVALEELLPATALAPVVFNGRTQSGYKVVVAAEGFLAETLVIEAPAGRTVVPFKLRKEPPPVHVALKVIDQAGQPVGGARIECIWSRATAESRWWAEGKTAIDGTFEFDIPYQRLAWTEGGTVAGTISLRAVHEELGEGRLEVPGFRASQNVTPGPLRLLAPPPGDEEGK